jgi:hypothetical protein
MSEELNADKFIATIADGLRHAIRDHGPITKELIGSAAKRVWSRIQNTKHDPRGAGSDATCEWKADSDGCWDTACGQAFYFDDRGAPREHGFKFCPFCRKNVK